MHCISCGTMLQPGMMICPKCGTPASYSALTPPPAPAVYGTNSDPTLPAAGSGPFIETISAPPGTQAGRTPPPNFYNQSTYQNTRPPNESIPVLPYNAAQQPYSPYPQPPQVRAPVQTPPPQRRGLSRGIIILLSILVLLIVAGSAIIYYFSVPYPAQIRAQATATAQTLVNNRATGTALAVHHAGETATAQAQATLTAQQNIYLQATQGNPALTGSLATNDTLNWNEVDSASSGGCVFAGGSYHVKELEKGFFEPCFAQSSNFSNFTLQVQMTILSGDFGGILFRADSQSSKTYLLQFGTDGSYQLYKYVDNSGNNSQTLLTSFSSAIKGQNQPNLLTLIARGSQLTVFVNKQYVDTVSDNAYKSGLVGFLAYYKSNPTEVTFSNIQIWKL